MSPTPKAQPESKPTWERTASNMVVLTPPVPWCPYSGFSICGILEARTEALGAPPNTLRIDLLRR